MRFLRCLLFAFLLGTGQTVTADILYSVTDLGGIDLPFSTEGTAINNAGQVTGGDFVFSLGSFHAFLYSNGVMRDLGTPRRNPDDLTWGYSINNAGQVTGEYSRGDESYHHAFLYSNGQMVDLGALPGGSFSIGKGINDAGQVVGYSDISNTANNTHAFLYHDGQMSDLGTLGGRYSAATGINNAGQITGAADTSAGTSHAFLYSNGVMADLGTLGGDTSSSGSSINNTGQVTGSSSHFVGSTLYEHAFLYSNGVMADLGTLGGGNSVGNSINNAGKAVGFADTPSGSHAFLYSDGQMYDLNDLINPALHLTLERATAINDQGQIVANTYVNHSFLPNRSYLLTPVPEPSTLALFGVALLGLGAYLHRRRLYNHECQWSGNKRHKTPPHRTNRRKNS